MGVEAQIEYLLFELFMGNAYFLLLFSSSPFFISGHILGCVARILPKCISFDFIVLVFPSRSNVLTFSMRSNLQPMIDSS